MSFDEKYFKEPVGTIIEETVVKLHSPSVCHGCRKDTHFFDKSSVARVCCIECKKIVAREGRKFF